MEYERDAGGGTGCARRRRERRLRSFLRHERMAVAMALAESQHHSAQRPKMARAGGEVRDALHGHVPEQPLPQGRFPATLSGCAAGATGGDYAARFEHMADICPFVQILDAPLPQTGNQLLEVFRLLDTQMPVEQVIEVPKISLDSIPQRFVDRRRPQKAEQLVEVPTVLSHSWIQQQIAEQFVDNPVPRGSGIRGGLQGFPPGQDSLQRTVEQIADIPVPGVGSHSPLSYGASPAVLRGKAGQEVFCTFKKLPKTLGKQVKNAPARQLMDAGGL